MAKLINPFDNLTKMQINKLYDLLDVHIYKYKKYQEVLPTIKNTNIVGIILNGDVQITRTDYSGNEIIIEELSENGVFSTNMSRISSSNTQIIAKESTEVLVIDYNKLMNPKNLEHRYFNIFFHNVFSIINERYKETNERIQIIEKKQIRDRLLEYFNINYKKTLSKNIYLPHNLKDLADYIASNRSAMFRELRNLKDDHFIEIKGKRITLLYK